MGNSRKPGASANGATAFSRKANFRRNATSDTSANSDVLKPDRGKESVDPIFPEELQSAPFPVGSSVCQRGNQGVVVFQRLLQRLFGKMADYGLAMLPARNPMLLLRPVRRERARRFG